MIAVACLTAITNFKSQATCYTQGGLNGKCRLVEITFMGVTQIDALCGEPAEGDTANCHYDEP